MKLFQYIVLATFLMATNFSAIAQEEVVPLSTHPVLIKNRAADAKISQAKNVSAVKLPFIDDFTKNHYRPDANLWADRNVLINKDYGVDVVSVGVATFDGLDQFGKVYPVASSFPTKFDKLTSREIRLDTAFENSPYGLTPADSVYLSFYVQPQGKGNIPEPEDSLILEFYKPRQNKWTHVWGIKGDTLSTFIAKYGSAFHMFMVPVTDTAYFHPDFQFRFTNYGSIADNSIPSFKSGMYDHWHLDYVVLDYGRTKQDLGFNDVAIRTAHKSLLANYISMPWNQYQANPTGEMKASVDYVFKSLDPNPIIKNMNQYFSIQNLDDGTFYKDTPYPATLNMNPLDELTYTTKYQTYTFTSSSTPYADFEVMFNILTNSPPPDINRDNDTMRFYQRFYNYYAYDDGVPEAGYGLSTANGKVALKFTLNTPDSLQAIQYYFNHTLGEANQQFFYVTVWDDQGGKPGNIIYEASGAKPEFEDSLFRFITYELDEALYLTGTFYIGFRQTTGDNLNVGLDRYSDNKSKLYYTVGGNWINSSITGSVMMRPIMGNNASAHVDINNLALTDKDIHIYPNPNNTSILSVKAPSEFMLDKNSSYQIFHSNGQLVDQNQIAESIDINQLTSGVYYIIFTNSDNNIRLQKKLVVIK